MAITAYQVAEITGVAPLDNVMQLLTDFGFFRVVLPFLLIFAIFYAVLLKTKVLGDGKQAQNLSAIVSLAAAFLVIAYTPVVDALAILIPQASFLLVVVLMFLMLVAFIFPGDWETTLAGKFKWVIGIASIVFVIILVGVVGGAVGEEIPVLHQFTQFIIGNSPFETGGGESGLAIDPNTMNTLIGLGIVIGIPLLVIVAVLFGGGSSGDLEALRAAARRKREEEKRANVG